MRIQINSDKTIAVDARLVQFAKTEVAAGLERFEDRLTRVEVHFSDIDGRKTGVADKRCLVEVRPAGSQPISVSAVAKRLDTAIHSALSKMRRALTTFFGKHDLAPQGKAAPATRKKAAAKRPAAKAAKSKTPSAPKKAAAKQTPETAETDTRAKKKRIYQARRKAWPQR